MTLDEAITKAEEVAEQCDRECRKVYPNAKSNYAKEHRQIAEWLKDYKRLKEQEPKTDWIPTSKILPKEDGEYLVTAVVHDEDYMLHDIPFVDVMRFDKEYADMFDNGWTNTYTSEFYYGVEVTAWMPYFEPYRTESEDVK